MGGVHGKNRLGGNSLLDCVVYGRISGVNASNYLFQNCLNYLNSDSNYKSTLKSIASHLKGAKQPEQQPEQQASSGGGD